MKPASDRRDTRPCDEVVTRLRARLPELSNEFGVEEIALFGSVARGESRDVSDIDLMVVLARPLGWDLVLLRDRLEAILEAPVDLVVRGGLQQSPALWDRVRPELVYV